MSVGNCDWPGCIEKGGRHVDRHSYCQAHEIDQLRNIVLGLIPTLIFDDDGRPGGIFRNRFARLVANATAWALHKARIGTHSRPDDSPELESPVRTLSKGKIETRAYAFTITGNVVEFLIERHPVGRVMEQRWSFDLVTYAFTLLNEVEVESMFPKDAAGENCCPRCGRQLDLTPGRARCECGYEYFHEHGLGG